MAIHLPSVSVSGRMVGVAGLLVRPSAALAYRDLPWEHGWRVVVLIGLRPLFSTFRFGRREGPPAAGPHELLAESGSGAPAPPGHQANAPDRQYKREREETGPARGTGGDL